MGSVPRAVLAADHGKPAIGRTPLESRWRPLLGGKCLVRGLFYKIAPVHLDPMRMAVFVSRSRAGFVHVFEKGMKHAVDSRTLARYGEEVSGAFDTSQGREGGVEEGNFDTSRYMYMIGGGKTDDLGSFLASLCVSLAPRRILAFALPRARPVKLGPLHIPVPSCSSTCLLRHRTPYPRVRCLRYLADQIRKTQLANVHSPFYNECSSRS